MSGTFGQRSQTSEYQKLQPKFKDCVFEYDKNPSQLRAWIRQIGSIVRNSVPGYAGTDLEAFAYGWPTRGWRGANGLAYGLALTITAGKDRLRH